MPHKTYLKQKHNQNVVNSAPLATGFGVEGHKIWLENGSIAALKANFNTASEEFMLEANMLQDLAKASWPVPKILVSDKHLLLMTWIENDGTNLTNENEYKTGKLLATLHQTPAPYFGYEYDTRIGALHQPNPKTESWITFFKTHRLMHMAQKAVEEGPLPETTYERIQNLSDNLENWITEPEHPTLIHGDLWGGNIIINDCKLQGFIDPANYNASPEIELAFTQMFNSFGKEFFKGYQSVTKLDNAFFTHRIDLYNLYPTLVHLRLFGNSYLPPIERTLTKLGY